MDAALPVLLATAYRWLGGIIAQAQLDKVTSVMRFKFPSDLGAQAFHADVNRRVTFCSILPTDPTVVQVTCDWTED